MLRCLTLPKVVHRVCSTVQHKDISHSLPQVERGAAYEILAFIARADDLYHGFGDSANEALLFSGPLAKNGYIGALYHSIWEPYCHINKLQALTGRFWGVRGPYRLHDFEAEFLVAKARRCFPAYPGRRELQTQPNVIGLLHESPELLIVYGRNCRRFRRRAHCLSIRTP